VAAGAASAGRSPAGGGDPKTPESGAGTVFCANTGFSEASFPTTGARSALAWNDVPVRLGVGCTTVPTPTAARACARSGRETTPADPSTEGAGEETPTAVFALRIGVPTCTGVTVPFEVSA